VIFLIILRFFPRVQYSSSLPSKDPFSWTASIFYLLDHQHIKYDWFGDEYPCGFTFLNAGTLLIAPSKTIAFYYMKFGFIPYLFLLILCLYSILIQFYKDNFEYIFFCIILTFAHNFLLQRTILFLPSLIVNILILISILILTTKIPNYLLGFTIPAMFLIHNISGLFFYLVLLLYYILQIIKSIKNIHVLKKIILDIIIIIIIAVSILLPYFIHMYIKWGDDLFYLINYYIENTLNLESSENFIIIKNYKFLLLNENNNAFIIEALNKIDEFINKRTIGLFIIFTVIAFFFKPKNKNKYFKDLLMLTRISFFILICIFIAPYILNLNFILENKFYQIYSYRAIESYFYSVLFLATIGWNWFILKLKKLWKLIRKKSEKIKQLIENHNFKINFKIIAIILTITIPLYYSSTRQKYYVGYVYKSYYIESILFIIDNISNDSVLAIPDFNTDNDSRTVNSYSRLLYDYKYYYYNFSQFRNYLELYNFCIINKINYILLKLTSWNENITKNIQEKNDFELIYAPLEKDWVYRIYKFKK
ncbi:MAG: hypothetical protein ACP6IY_20855, partial [Promethearchaeia archaeon]